MAKDPAFLFYSSDFLSGVSDLTMEERGQYITLLCLQHQKSGRLSRKAVAIAVPNAAADVMAKFTEDELGLLYNERLEIEMLKRQSHSEKQRQRAIDGWKKRKGEKQAAANAPALPLENENENRNEVNILFNIFWDLYDKKRGDKEKIEKKWNSLSDSDRQLIIDYIPDYKKSQPDKQFRKDPSSFLNQKSWNDEIIMPINKTGAVQGIRVESQTHYEEWK